MFYIDTKPDGPQLDVNIVRYYFVLCTIWYEESLDGQDSGTDGTFVLLQIPTDNLTKLSDADEPDFRDYISMRIPYYHYFESLSKALDPDFMFATKYPVLKFNNSTDMFEIVSFDDVFLNRFKLDRQ